MAGFLLSGITFGTRTDVVLAALAAGGLARRATVRIKFAFGSGLAASIGKTAVALWAATTTTTVQFVQVGTVSLIAVFTGWAVCLCLA